MVPLSLIIAMYHYLFHYFCDYVYCVLFYTTVDSSHCHHCCCFYFLFFILPSIRFFKIIHVRFFWEARTICISIGPSMTIIFYGHQVIGLSYQRWKVMYVLLPLLWVKQRHLPPLGMVYST